ncbi:MAG: MBL fold metallo-hydrolase [Bacteroidetes bacterium MedPE-SWsnd-G1]|nr:MAG: MBL fold metallo-hydrolase [Bacteroidetes bacterium MedPE-SWsnd-G1]
MKVEQIYTGCLAHAAYYIESKGEAVIIDPLREVQPYLERAAADNAKIKYIFETHFHADFVSGHIDLKNKTGATIVFGPTAKPNYDALIAEDNQVFKIGDYQIKVLHTPGHTMESTTYLLIDENGKEHGIVTGDTLFIGDVGRPDLAQHVVSDLTEEILAGHLFDSLRTKIMPLSDDLIVYPNHGAGSACGKKMSKETTDTLGNQKAVNYALRADMTKEEFIKELLTGLTAPPKYFPQNVMMNIQGYKSFDDVMEKASQPLSPIDFEAMATETGAVVLDVRHQSEYIKGHIPNSIFIGIDGGFAPWVGALIADVSQPILLVTPEGREEETVTRLARVGFDNTLGFLEGGFENWKKASKEYDTITSISAEEFKRRKENDIPVFDVRKEGEFKAEHVADAKHTSLDALNSHLNEYPQDDIFYVHCQGGYRSVIAASILKSRGIHNLVDVAGGYKAIKEAGVEVTDYVCPSTLS